MEKNGKRGGAYGSRGEKSWTKKPEKGKPGTEQRNLAIIPKAKMRWCNRGWGGAGNWLDKDQGKWERQMEKRGKHFGVRVPILKNGRGVKGPDDRKHRQSLLNFGGKTSKLEKKNLSTLEDSLREILQ